MASQQLQFKKLIAPFRSPLMPKRDEDLISKDLAKSTSPLPVILPPSTPKLPLTPQKAHPPHLHIAPSVTLAKTRIRTLKAASQFKSPLSSSASAPSGKGLSIRLTPTIQSLERKLQLLRRAIKVKANDEEMTLVGLVKKWTEAGREIAYELWDLAKDSANNGSAWNGGGSKGKSDSEDRNWGWDSPGIKRAGPENEMSTNMDNYSDAHTKIHLEEDEETRNNIGTMLRQLGIAPETLGWDEDAEAFFDRD